MELHAKGLQQGLRVLTCTLEGPLCSGAQVQVGTNTGQPVFGLLDIVQR